MFALFNTIFSFLLLFNFVYTQNYFNNSSNNNNDNLLFNNILNYDFNEIQIYLTISNTNIKNKNICENDIEKIVNGFQNYEEWALKMIDATGKLGSGILRGNIKSLGHYDECVETEGPDLTGQYCLSTLHVNSENKEWNNIIHTMTLGAKEREKMKDYEKSVPDFAPALSQIQLGICIPSSCSAFDAQTLINSALQNASINSDIQISATILQEECYVLESKPWTTSDIIFMSIISAFILLAVIGTTYEQIVPRNSSENKTSEILRSFSLQENWNRLINTDSPGTFTALDGIRVFSSFRVILGHKTIFYMQQPWINKSKVLQSVSNFLKMPLVNNIPSVDTFFMASGLLRSYSLLRDLENNRHDFVSSVWKRYLRLTPAYAMMIWFNLTLAPRLGSGPNWNKFVTVPTVGTCTDNWLYNLLYINNYVNNGKYCLQQSWYLAADMQLFLIAPLLVYPLWKWPQKAMHILVISIFVATLIPLFTIFYMSALPTYLPGASNIELVKYAMNLHLPTHVRTAAYIVGLALGYLMFNLASKKVQISKITVATGWSLCILMLYAVVFGPYKYMQYDYVYNVWEMVLYGALHRPVWAIAVAWIVFACHLGYGGWINTFFSAKIFQPLSRISYCIFLSHYVVLMVGTGRIRTAIYVEDYDIFRSFVADLFIILIAATLLHLFIEAPIAEFVRILQRKEKCKTRTANSEEKLQNISHSTISMKKIFEYFQRNCKSKFH